MKLIFVLFLSSFFVFGFSRNNVDFRSRYHQIRDSVGQDVAFQYGLGISGAGGGAMKREER